MENKQVPTYDLILYVLTLPLTFFKYDPMLQYIFPIALYCTFIVLISFVSFNPISSIKLSIYVFYIYIEEYILPRFILPPVCVHTGNGHVHKTTLFATSFLCRQQCPASRILLCWIFVDI